MKTVLAAVDRSPAARPVIEAALGIGRLLDADVEALHVSGDPAGEPITPLDKLAEESGVPLRVRQGPVEATLLDALAGDPVVACVVGARATPGGPRPVGHTALAVARGSRKPVLVVPPEAVGVSPRPFRRILVPLEGSATSSRPVVEQLLPLIVDEVEVTVAHVFTPATMPRVLDHPERDMELLGREFLTRHCPGADHIRWRVGGPVGSEITDLCNCEAADLVVLSWSQDLSPDRAAVVREVLATSHIPVLLLPVT